MRLRVGFRKSKPTEELTPKPQAYKKDYQVIFRKYISIGEHSEEHYDGTGTKAPGT